MTIRNATATLLVSTLLLASGSAFAAQQAIGGASIERQLSETADALRDQNSAALGREETFQAEHNLQIARDLARQGQTASAQRYLDLARGTLGLATGPGATEVTGSAEAAFSAAPRAASDEVWKSFSKDFYTPYGGA